MKNLDILASMALCLLPAACASSQAGTFATPEEAVQRLAASGYDEAAADELLGPGGFSLLTSGDEVADREDAEAVRAMARERVEFEDVAEDCRIARLGADGWELPIPLVRDEDGRWRFDVEAGREEILNRRVGRNEISTLATLRAIVDAQHEYASQGRDGEPPAFAQRFWSSPQKHDGLYWETAEHEEESPLGALVAEAAVRADQRADSKPTPYHGYYYRLLTAQGVHAPGGQRSYLDKAGRLSGGFAVLAWPATHGNSGVMTFLVNHRGIVFQKDLGSDTEKVVAGIRAYDPDSTWSPTSD